MLWRHSNLTQSYYYKLVEHFLHILNHIQSHSSLAKVFLALSVLLRWKLEETENKLQLGKTQMSQPENLRSINTTENCVQTRQKRSKNLTILPAQIMRIELFQMNTDAWFWEIGALNVYC